MGQTFGGVPLPHKRSGNFRRSGRRAEAFPDHSPGSGARQEKNEEKRMEENVMKRKVVMTGPVGVMTDANLKLMKDLLESKVDAEF